MEAAREETESAAVEASRQEDSDSDQDSFSSSDESDFVVSISNNTPEKGESPSNKRPCRGRRCVACLVASPLLSNPSVLVPCGHVVHEKCFRAVLSSSDPSCPECGMRISTKCRFYIDPRCSICYEAMDAHPCSVLKACGHVYHEKCLTAWLRTPGSLRCCPKCMGTKLSRIFLYKLDRAPKTVEIVASRLVASLQGANMEKLELGAIQGIEEFLEMSWDMKKHRRSSAIGAAGGISVILGSMSLYPYNIRLMYRAINSIFHLIDKNAANKELLVRDDGFPMLMWALQQRNHTAIQRKSLVTLCRLLSTAFAPETSAVKVFVGLGGIELLVNVMRQHGGNVDFQYSGLIMIRRLWTMGDSVTRDELVSTGCLSLSAAVFEAYNKDPRIQQAFKDLGSQISQD